jgi:hypothetical protein
MGILLQGPNGPFIGRVGNTVYYMLNGVNVCRQIGKNNKPPSDQQLSNRIATKLSGTFFCKVKGFIETGFGIEAQLMNDNAYNRAVKNNKKQMIEGKYPNLLINYSQILLSVGELKPATAAKVSQTAEGLTFSWEITPKMPWPESIDQAMMLAYFPEENRSEYLLFGSDRASGTAELTLPPSLQGKYMETYLSFISSDRKQVANSVYTGSLNKNAVVDQSSSIA